ncbi:MAG: DUF695 domain-containing protein [Weeksellaceae bacterium]
MKESTDIKVLIPDENYQIMEFNQEEKYGIAVINTALQDDDLKEVFSWNCSIMLELENTTKNGMPIEDEFSILEDFEKYLDDNIKGENKEKPNALFFGRVTWNSTRQLIWKVYEPKISNDFLQELIESENYPFEFDYRIEEDDKWELTKWYSEKIKK